MQAPLQVIVVEDSAAASEVLARHLAKTGLDFMIQRVETEGDFTSALRKTDPQLILSDFSMPRFDGLRALEIAVAHAPETPFIFVSGTIGEERAVDALRRGATDYVLKINLSSLPSRIQRALREASLKAEQHRSERHYREQLVQAALSERSRNEERLRRRIRTLEETLRVRTAGLDEANARLREQMRLRQAAEVELGLAQKLEAVGRLAAGIAHEINTPIQFISDSVHFLGSSFEEILGFVPEPDSPPDSPPDENRTGDLAFLKVEVPRAIDRIKEGTQRVATIVRAMKEFAHPDATEKAPADLNRAIETTLLIASSEYKYVATVELELGTLPDVMCNVGELCQVFLNLIVNAAHALADAGRDPESGRIVIRTQLAEEWAELQFEDNGCGIPKEVIDKIYDPFFTTKEVGRGSGQGLGIARSIVVEKHAGRISVASTPGVGTCFTLRLPINTPSGELP